MRIELCDGAEAWPQAEILDNEVYPPQTRATLVWREIVWAQADKRVMVWDGETLVCHVGIYLRDATHDTKKLRVAGIGGVMTHPKHRQKSHASAALGCAANFMRDETDADCGLLFCEPHNADFYAKRGWRPFAGEVMIQQPSQRLLFNMMGTMILPIQAEPFSGTIDLCGLPW